MSVLGIMVLIIIISIATGVVDPESLNISITNSSTTSVYVEEKKSLTDSFLEKTKETQLANDKIIAIFWMVFVILLVGMAGIWVMFGIKRANKIDRNLDELEDSLGRISGLHRFEAVRDDSDVRGKYKHGTRLAPKKRARQIYESSYSSDKVVNDLMETGGFNPRDLKLTSKNLDQLKERPESILCPKCKKVHIQTDEEGCWFCNYRWGDNIE